MFMKYMAMNKVVTMASHLSTPESVCYIPAGNNHVILKSIKLTCIYMSYLHL